MNGTIVERSKTLSDARRRPRSAAARAASPFGSDATKKIGSRSRKQGKGTRWIGIDGAIASDAIRKQGNERVDPRYRST